MGYLAGRMHTGVGAPGRAQLHLAPKHRRERLLENARDRSLTRLRCPSGEIRAVIGDIEPKTNAPAISVDGGRVVVQRQIARTCQRPRPWLAAQRLRAQRLPAQKRLPAQRSPPRLAAPAWRRQPQRTRWSRPPRSRAPPRAPPPP